MLNRIRESVEPVLEWFGAQAIRAGLPPMVWTLLGFAFAVLSGAVYAGLYWRGVFYAGVLLLVSGLMDIVDGSVARLTKRATAAGAFTDSTVDRLSEIVVYLGILASGIVNGVLVLTALSLSLMVSYARARGESLGVKLRGVGVGERAERLMVLAAASIAGYVDIGVVLVAALAAITFLHRFFFTIASLKRSG